jgi:predicted nucleic acid-binding protein
MSKKDKIILLDADVIIHFMKAQKHLLLPYIFPNNQLCVLDVVTNELLKRKSAKIQVENLFVFGLVQQLSFPINEYSNPIFKEFVRLKKEKGDGESACMAYARYNENILASSNLKDIKNYCHEHKIQYLTTMDFLCEALKIGVMTEVDCNDFLFIIHYEGSKLPVLKMADYDCINKQPI